MILNLINIQTFNFTLKLANSIAIVLEQLTLCVTSYNSNISLQSNNTNLINLELFLRMKTIISLNQYESFHNDMSSFNCIIRKLQKITSIQNYSKLNTLKSEVLPMLYWLIYSIYKLDAYTTEKLLISQILHINSMPLE